MIELEAYYNSCIEQEYKSYVAMNKNARLAYAKSAQEYLEYFEKNIVALCAECGLDELAVILATEFYDSCRSLVFLMDANNANLDWDILTVCTTHIIYYRIAFPFIKAIKDSKNPANELKVIYANVSKPPRPRTEFVMIMGAYAKYWSNKQPDDDKNT